MRVRGLLVLAAAAALVLVPPRRSRPRPHRSCDGTVGPGFSITLERRRRSSRHARSTRAPTSSSCATSRRAQLPPLRAGRRGVDGVEATEDRYLDGDVPWTAATPSSAIRTRRRCCGEFVVGNPPPATAPTPPRRPAAPKLLATVGPKARSRSGARAGAALDSLKAGTYSIVVRDRSKLHNFHLVGTGVNRSSAVAAAGTMTWKLTLSKPARSASTPTRRRRPSRAPSASPNGARRLGLTRPALPAGGADLGLPVEL